VCIFFFYSYSFDANVNEDGANFVLTLL
jgi:hypothetical protein